MRLSPDTLLLNGPGAPPELADLWREERLPCVHLPAPEQLAAALDDHDAITVVLAGEGAQDAAARAVALGCRVFVVGGVAPDGARAATLAEAMAAARLARARERWKAARRGGGV